MICLTVTCTRPAGNCSFSSSTRLPSGFTEPCTTVSDVFIGLLLGRFSAFSPISFISYHASHLQPHRSHQRQGVAMLHHARLQAKIERHNAVLEMIGEVDVGRAARRVGRRCASATDHASSPGRARPLPPGRAPPTPRRAGGRASWCRRRFRPAKTAAAAARAIDRPPAARAESPRRNATGPLAANPGCAASRRGRAATAAAAGAHRRPCQGQHGVDADRAQKRTLSGHIRSADD